MDTRSLPVLEQDVPQVESRPAGLRAPTALPARQAFATAAAVAAIGGSWMMMPSSEPVSQPSARQEAACPVPAPAPAPALEPLVAFTHERPISAGDEGLASFLLRGAETPAPAQATQQAAPALASLESRFQDKRVPEHVAKHLLGLVQSRAGLVELGKGEGFVTVGLGNNADYKSRGNGTSFARGALFAVGGLASEAVLANVLSKKEILGGAMERDSVAMTLRGSRLPGFRGGNAWKGQEEALFSEEILAMNPDKPICRMGGSLCRMPDGKIFALESMAQYDALAKDGLVVFPSPLVFDLDGDGVRTSDRKVRFDIDGDGIVDNLFDISTKDGILVFDAEGDGLSGEHAREIFGTETDLDRNGLPDGFEDGFQAFAAFVARARREGALAAAPAADGWLTAADVSALETRYGLRMRVGSLRAKAVSLKEAGVSGIRLSDAKPRRIRDFDGQKNDLMRQEGARFTRADGSEGVYEDVWFRARTPRSRAVAAAKRKAAGPA